MNVRGCSKSKTSSVTCLHVPIVKVLSLSLFVIVTMSAVPQLQIEYLPLFLKLTVDEGNKLYMWLKCHGLLAPL